MNFNSTFPFGVIPFTALFRRPSGPRTAAAFALIGGLALIAAGCGDHQPALPADAVAVVHGQVVTRAEVERTLASHGWSKPTIGQKRAALGEIIQREAIYAKALDAHWETNETVRAAVKNYIVSDYRENLRKELTTARQPEEQEIQGRYEDLVREGRMTTPEQARVAMLFIPVSRVTKAEKRLELKGRMESLRVLAADTCRNEPGFGVLSITNSAHQQSRYRGGDIGWMSRELAGQLLGPDAAPWLFDLKEKGELSPVIEGKNGVYLFKSIDHKAAGTRPFTEVRAAIAQQLQRERNQARESAFAASVKEGVAIQIQEPVLAQVTGPPAIVASRPPRLSAH